jgi:hypothetical protein
LLSVLLLFLLPLFALLLLPLPFPLLLLRVVGLVLLLLLLRVLLLLIHNVGILRVWLCTQPTTYEKLSSMKLKQHVPTESVIVNKIMKRLAPLCKVRKRHGSGFAVRGDPDLFGCLPLDHPVWPGRHFELEVKRPGEKPTPLQNTRLAEWQAAGALTGVVSDPEHALSILRFAGAGKTLAEIFAEEDEGWTKLKSKKEIASCWSA